MAWKREKASSHTTNLHYACTTTPPGFISYSLGPLLLLGFLSVMLFCFITSLPSPQSWLSSGHVEQSSSLGRPASKCRLGKVSLFWGLSLHFRMRSASPLTTAWWTFMSSPLHWELPEGWVCFAYWSRPCCQCRPCMESWAKQTLDSQGSTRHLLYYGSSYASLLVSHVVPSGLVLSRGMESELGS